MIDGLTGLVQNDLYWSTGVECHVSATGDAIKHSIRGESYAEAFRQRINYHVSYTMHRE
jgi:hypothetical protein